MATDKLNNVVGGGGFRAALRPSSRVQLARLCDVRYRALQIDASTQCSLELDFRKPAAVSRTEDCLEDITFGPLFSS
jgi:hypothetical protein